MVGVVEGEVDCAPTLSGWVRRLVVVMCLFPLALLAQSFVVVSFAQLVNMCIFMHGGGCCQAREKLVTAHF